MAPGPRPRGDRHRPRTAFATPERFPGIDLVALWADEALTGPVPPLDRYCAVAALTHDPKIDDPALMAALRAECFYVGRWARAKPTRLGWRG